MEQLGCLRSYVNTRYEEIRNACCDCVEHDRLMAELEMEDEDEYEYEDDGFEEPGGSSPRLPLSFPLPLDSFALMSQNQKS